MKKTEFQKRLTNSLMEAILAEVLQDNSLPCIRFTSKGRTVRLQIGDGMDKVQIYINHSAEVSYMLYGFGGNNVRRIYYSYGDNDDHEDVIDKATEDFALLVKAFLKNQDLHDFTEMILTFDRDNTPTIERYLHLYDWDEDEEDENL